MQLIIIFALSRSVLVAFYLVLVVAGSSKFREKFLVMGTGQPLPVWFTREYIENALQNFYKTDQVTVTDYSTKPATKKGGNYASVMHRVSVDFVKNQKSVSSTFILKVIPGGLAGSILSKNKLFPREIQVYNEILPRIDKLLENVNDFTKFSPECIHTSTSPDMMLLLEDLEASSYEIFDHGRLLNLDHALPILMKLAKFHAATAVIHEQYPGFMDVFMEGQISNNPERQDFLGFFPANMRSLAEEVAQWPGYEVIAGKLFGLVETVIPKGIELFNDDENSFRVLNQGDLWVKNCMFKYNNFEPQDILLLDYQLAHFGSPAIDLNYFLYGSINENVRKVHFKFMVRYYHCALKETLERLNYKGRVPTLKDIHIELIRKSLHAVIAAVCLTPIILMDLDRCPELEGLIDQTDGGAKFRKDNIENVKYKTFIQKTLKEFELSGFLD